MALRGTIYVMIWAATIQNVLGCAASSKSTVVKSMLAPIDRNARVVVAGTAKNPAHQEDALALVMEVGRRLNAASQVAQVDVEDGSGKQSDILINCEVTGVRKVSAAARVMVGAFAGQAGMDVHVSVVKSSSREIVGEANITGTGSGGTVFAGTTNQAIEQAADGVVKFVLTR